MQSERRHRSKHISLTRFIRLGWVGFCLVFVAACHLDMYNQPRYQPYEESTFFRDGSSARPLEPGTVSRSPAGAGPQSVTGAQSVGVSSGREGDTFVATNPLPVNDELRARGEDRYKIFCAPCHGELANGKGVTARYFNPPPPSFYLDRLKNEPDGFYYDVITNGYGQMFSYASRIPIEDRWAIVAYIRELQENPPEKLKPEDFVETTPTPEGQKGGDSQQATPAPTPSS